MLGESRAVYYTVSEELLIGKSSLEYHPAINFKAMFRSLSLILPSAQRSQRVLPLTVSVDFPLRAFASEPDLSFQMFRCSLRRPKRFWLCRWL